MEKNTFECILDRLPTKIEVVSEQANEVYFLTLRRIFKTEDWVAGYESLYGKVFVEAEGSNYFSAINELENNLKIALDNDSLAVAYKSKPAVIAREEE